jgi:hypothetical protein
MDRAVLLSILLLLGLRPLIQGQALGDRKNPAAQTDHKAGVTVEKVGTNSEAEKAELQEGDVLLAWSCRAAKGEVDSPFDVTRIEIDQAPRGAVMLTGLRGAVARGRRQGECFGDAKVETVASPSRGRHIGGGTAMEGGRCCVRRCNSEERGGRT